MLISALLANMVKETISSGGTGNITMSGAVSGFNTFSDYYTDGPGVSYHLSEGADWETGIGHLTTTQTILVRDQILRKSVSGTVTDLPATGMNITNSGFVSVRPNAVMQLAGFSAAGGNSGFFKSHRVGGWVNSGKGGGAFSAQSGRIVWSPIFLDFPVIMTAIGGTVATAFVTGNFRMAIYNSTFEGLPKDLIVETGDLSTDATGEVLETLASPILLPAGIYYKATAADNTTAQFQDMRGSKESYTPNIYGGIAGGNSDQYPYKNQTYGAFPSTFPTPTAHHNWESIGLIWQ